MIETPRLQVEGYSVFIIFTSFLAFDKFQILSGGNMNHSLRFVFIIFPLLLAFVSNGIAQQMSSEDRNECFYTMKVYPEYAHQVSTESLEVDLHYNRLNPIEGTETAMPAETVRFELVFLLMQYDSTKAPFRVSGVGESRNFQGYFSVPKLSTERPTVIDIIREAIREGYKQIKDILGTHVCAIRPLVSTISRVEEDRIQIPLGTSNHVRVGDVFSIYPKEYYNQYRIVDEYLIPYLATGVVIEIGDNISTLRIDDVDGIGVQVQAGDVVELISGSRRQERQVNVLHIGRIPPHIVVHFVDQNEEIARQEITSIIRELLVEEAAPFSFQVE